MGKHSSFERNPRDYYPTPEEAIASLLGQLKKLHDTRSLTFIEPCAGDGRLVRHLTKRGFKCAYACDIEPQADWIKKQDILFFDMLPPFPFADFIITNPPWEREVLHRMIEVFRSNRPTWLLLDANWMFTRQARPYLAFCERIVSVGRISWMGNGVSGFDDCCWYHFIDSETKTTFIP